MVYRGRNRPNDMENQNIELMKGLIGQKLTHVPSGLTKWLGGSLSKVEIGSVRVTYRVREDMLNPAGTLHGGIIATMLDDLVGMTMFTTGENVFFSTINLAVDYFESARLGDIVIAESKLMKKGKRVANIELTLMKDNGNLIAKAHTNLIKTQFDLKQKILSSQ